VGIAYKDGWVIDESVGADNANLNDAHMSKCTRYDTSADLICHVH